MGRYCYFDSGFVYKFWFGVQESGFYFLEKDGIVCSNQQEVLMIRIDDPPVSSCNLDEVDDHDKFLDWMEENGLTDGDYVDENMKGFDKGWIDKYVYRNDDSYTFRLDIDQKKLLNYIQNYGFPLPDWDSFTKDNSGTEDLYTTLLNRDFFTTEDLTSFLDRFTGKAYLPNKLRADFCLACILYHMSMYNSLITGRYELQFTF